MIVRKLIRADGTSMHLPAGKNISWLRTLIGADTLDTVMLRHMGDPLHVMLVDDQGIDKGLPANAEATRLYLANCKPGAVYTIRGDVIVVPDDFE